MNFPHLNVTKNPAFSNTNSSLGSADPSTNFNLNVGHSSKLSSPCKSVIRC